MEAIVFIPRSIDETGILINQSVVPLTMRTMLHNYKQLAYMYVYALTSKNNNEISIISEF